MIVPFLNVRLRKTFSMKSTIFIKTLNLVFHDTFLKRSNGNIFAMLYRKTTHTDYYPNINAHLQSSCKQNGVPSLLNRSYLIITNNNYLAKENSRTKQVLKVNGYQESVISNIFQRTTNSISLSQLNTKTNASHKYSRGRDQNEYNLTVS